MNNILIDILTIDKNNNKAEVSAVSDSEWDTADTRQKKRTTRGVDDNARSMTRVVGYNNQLCKVLLLTRLLIIFVF